jgi:hypothetical protein
VNNVRDLEVQIFPEIPPTPTQLRKAASLIQAIVLCYKILSPKNPL